MFLDEFLTSRIVPALTLTEKYELVKSKSCSTTQPCLQNICDLIFATFAGFSRLITTAPFIVVSKFVSLSFVHNININIKKHASSRWSKLFHALSSKAQNLS